MHKTLETKEPGNKKKEKKCPTRYLDHPPNMIIMPDTPNSFYSFDQMKFDKSWGRIAFWHLSIEHGF